MSKKKEDNKTTKQSSKETVKTLVPQRDIVNEILPIRYRLKCKTLKQKNFSNLITEKEIIVATGPAGVGKSYVAIARAIELIQNTSNQYNHIILINPAVEAEEKYGFMPGSLREKLDPFVGSSIDIIDKIVGIDKRLKLEEKGIVSVGALGFIRGKTIDNTILVMEEAQNMSPHQMKTLLTRIGSNSKFIISGDLDQSDRYSDYKQSGLYDVVLKHSNIKEFGFIEFDTIDIVRNPLITLILNNYKVKTPADLKKPKELRSERNVSVKMEVVDNTDKPNKKYKGGILYRLWVWNREKFTW